MELMGWKMSLSMAGVTSEEEGSDWAVCVCVGGGGGGE